MFKDEEIDGGTIHRRVVPHRCEPPEWKKHELVSGDQWSCKTCNNRWRLRLDHTNQPGVFTGEWAEVQLL